MKTILMLTDFSQVANNAAYYAVHMAQALHATLLLVHARKANSVQLPSKSNGYENNFQKSVVKLNELKCRLQQFAESRHHYLPRIVLISRGGNLPESVAHIIHNKKIDLIMMGAHPSDDASSFLFGHHVFEVVSNACCPVLMVPSIANFTYIKDIYFATDLRYCDLEAVLSLVSFAEVFKARVTLLHVGADGLPDLLKNEATAIFLDTVAVKIKYKVLSFIFIEGKNAEGVLNHVIANHAIDILVSDSRRYHFIKRLFAQHSKTKRNTYIRLPLMVMPVE